MTEPGTAEAAFQAELLPAQARGTHGRFHLRLVNPGAAALRVTLAGHDPAGRLRIGVLAPEPLLPPRSARLVAILVRPRAIRFAGPSRPCPFVVRAAAVDPPAAGVVEVAGLLIQAPRFRSARQAGLAGVLLGLTGVAGVALAGRTDPGPAAAGGAPAAGLSAAPWNPLLPPAPVPRPPPAPFFIGGFKTVHTAFPALIGDPLENEWYDPAGNAHQQTTHGQLTYLGGTNRLFFAGYGGNQARLYTFGVQDGRIVELPAR